MIQNRHNWKKIQEAKGLRCDDLEAIMRDWPEKASKVGVEAYGGDLCPAVGQTRFIKRFKKRKKKKVN